jgi:hypothetical protein
MLGIKCKTFVLLSGNFTVIDDISDETITASHDEAQADVRGSRVGESEPTVTRVEASIKVRKDTSDAVWQYLHQQFWTKAATTLLFLGDGAEAHAGNGVLDLANTSNGTLGQRFDAKLYGFTESRNLQDVLFNDITAKPCVNSNMTIAEVSAGNITYTAPASFSV